MRIASTRGMVAAAALAGALGCCADMAAADPILPGLYRLHNQQNSSGQPPPSGLRLEELFNATPGRDIFSLDFDDPRSALFLDINPAGTQIHIFGAVFGGRDVGPGYAADQYLGLYQLDFHYRVGVSNVPGDDDLCVDSSHANFGKLLAPSTVLDPLAYLTDNRIGGFSFRLGDEDQDNGHLGFDGIAGWGWLHLVDDQLQARADPVAWSFTAELMVPTPGASILLGLGFVALAHRRHRRPPIA